MFITTVEPAVYTARPRPTLSSSGPERSTLGSDGTCYTLQPSQSHMNDVVPTTRVDLSHLVPPFSVR
jgi:hypothetical protein